MYQHWLINCDKHIPLLQDGNKGDCAGVKAG